MDNQFFATIITILLSALTLMVGIVLFWIKHYIKTNDSEHSKLFELIDDIKSHLMRGN